KTDDAAIALLPTAIRPSVRSVALLNVFPFKTVGNRNALAGWGNSDTSLKTHMWERLLKPTLELLAPRVIICHPDCDPYSTRLSTLPSRPSLVRVWHPSDYNVKAQRRALAGSWQPLAAVLEALQA